MVAALVLIGLLMPTLQIAGAQSVGVCYGQKGNNLPSQRDVVNLYKKYGIRRMRVYDPAEPILQALRGKSIEIILDVPNSDLQNLASNPSAAVTWVQNNIRNYSRDVRFRYIAVGNEVDPYNENVQYISFVLPTMRNVHDAIVAAGLQGQIKVSTATYTGVLIVTSPPSAGLYRPNVRSFIDPIINFLVQNNLPLLVNVYPHIAITGNSDIQLPYALFTAPGVVVTDSDRNLEYRNLFVAILDAHYAALEKAGGPNVEIVVSESGWPTQGHPVATIDNAKTYNNNLIRHVKGRSGTPRRPGRDIETYIFAMFDETQKPSDMARHFGLFSPNQKLIYPISFK
uniref:Glucanase n=1 Tax=Sambucus nigra TaxID=4202 RepID=Q944C0_SAMNI|nr:glucanase [Sambucus nigra]